MQKKNATPDKLSRTERKDLDIEIGFIEGVVKRDPGFVEALLVLGDDYTRRGKYAEGLRVDLRLAKARPADPGVHYNLACSYALTDQMERAVQALNTALDLGYRDFKWLRRDPDLKPLRQHPLYRKLRAKIRALSEKS